MLRQSTFGLLAVQLVVGFGIATAADSPTPCHCESDMSDPPIFPAGPDGKLVTGAVIVHVCYEANGVVVSKRVTQTSGSEELDAAALKDVDKFAAHATATGKPPAVGCRDQKITFKPPPTPAVTPPTTPKE